MTNPKKLYSKPVIVSEGKVADLTKALVGHKFTDAAFTGDLTPGLAVSTGPLLP
jgi:hypothetical protein